MSVLVTENVKEEFSKPPPKKKWLQNYIEEDSTIGNNLREETQQFVKLLGRTQINSKEGLRQWKAANTSQKLTLSQNVIGGVVQGVIDQFHSFFENDQSPKEESSSESEQPEERLSQNEITPVVQSVISQFLNGSISDSGFRRSRKRSHKHSNSRHREEQSSSGVSYSDARGSSSRNSSVIKYLPSSGKTDRNPIKVRKIETMLEPTDSNEALNLSMNHRSNPKVTFAHEDRCYSTDSVKTFQKSKSQQLFTPEISQRIHENFKLIVEEDSPLNLAQKSASVQSVQPTFQTSVVKTFQSAVRPVIKINPIQCVPRHERKEKSDIYKNPSQQMILSESPNIKKRASLPTSRRSVLSLSPNDLSPQNKSGIFPPTSTSKTLKPANNAKVVFAASKQEQSLFTMSESFKPSPVSDDQALGSESGPKPSTREVHNRLEKNRRAHLKSCFNELAHECELDPSKASNVLVIRTAYKVIMSLKREEREHEKNMAALVQTKIRHQQLLDQLKRECSGMEPDSDED